MITSNIGGLRSRLRSLKTDLQEVSSQALDPAVYIDRLKEIARREIEAVFSDGFILTEEEDRAVQTLLSKVSVERAGTELDARIGGVSWKTLSAMDEAAPERRITREAMVDWILLYKDKKNIDRKPGGEVDVDAVAARIFHDMEAHPEHWFGTEVEGHGALNPRGLAQVVGVVQVPPEKLAMALERVLAAWNREIPGFAAENLQVQVKSAIARHAF